MKKILLSALCLVTIAACGGRKRIADFQGVSSAEVPNIVTIRTGWIKDKKNSFDAELWITNTGKTGIVVPVTKISCSRGGMMGSFRFSKYDGGFLQVVSGEQRRIIGKCALGAKNKGEWIISFKDIAALAENGGAGKVLSKEVNLRLDRSANN
jgi:hypothetical protein